LGVRSAEERVPGLGSTGKDLGVVIDPVRLTFFSSKMGVITSISVTVANRLCPWCWGGGEGDLREGRLT
jgi:hypothetical protein